MSVLYWWLIVMFALDVLSRVIMLGRGEVKQRTRADVAGDLLINGATLLWIVAIWR